MGDPAALAKVTGSRIKLLSLDVSEQYVVLGSSIGSVYVFGRCTELGGRRDPARTKVEAPEGPLRAGPDASRRVPCSAQLPAVTRHCCGSCGFVPRLKLLKLQY